MAKQKKEYATEPILVTAAQKKIIVDYARENSVSKSQVVGLLCQLIKKGMSYVDALIHLRVG